MPLAQKVAVVLHTYKDMGNRDQSPYFMMNRCLREQPTTCVAGLHLAADARAAGADAATPTRRIITAHPI
jgi:hypothetical protein